METRLGKATLAELFLPLLKKKVYAKRKEFAPKLRIDFFKERDKYEGKQT